MKDDVAHRPAALVGKKLEAELAGERLRLRLAHRQRIGTEHAADRRHFAPVGVAVRQAHPRLGETAVSGKEHGRPGQVHEREQPRVVGVIGSAVGQRPVHMVMDPANARDRRLCLGPRAIGRDRDEPRGVAQPTMHVPAEIAVVPDAGQRQRMQHLPQQSRDPADHHAPKVGMHPPRHPARGAQRIVRRHDRLLARGRVVEEPDHPAGNGAAKLFGWRGQRHEG